MKELSIFNQLRPVTVGFDSVFDNFERMFSDDFFSTHSSYPAYNIVRKKDNHYDVEGALAGFNKKDIKVSYADGQLCIESVKNDRSNEKDVNGNIRCSCNIPYGDRKIIDGKSTCVFNASNCDLYSIFPISYSGSNIQVIGLSWYLILIASK